VGGPTANFRIPSCEKQITKGICPQKQCLFPKPCPNLEVDHSDYLSLLVKLRNLPGVKKVFIRSGIRFDYLLKETNEKFFKELCEHHISGRLKIAPEHIDDAVLAAMGKPGSSVFEEFIRKYAKINKQLGKPQQVVPYFISSHPGSTLNSAIALAEYMRDHAIEADQVQDYYPTPGTLSTAMYFSGLDPRTMTPIFVCRDEREKNMQRALLQYRNPENSKLVHEALVKANRTDLIGFAPNCLVKPVHNGLKVNRNKPTPAETKVHRAEKSHRRDKGKTISSEPKKRRR